MLNLRQVATLAAVTALAPIALDMYLPALVELARDFGVSTGAASTTVSIFLFGIAGGQLVAGPLSDRVGRRWMILGGLVLFTLTSWLASMAQGLDVMLLARLGQALGACAALSSSRAMVSDRLDPDRAAALFSQMALIGGLAPILAPLAGAWLVLLGGWRLNFWVMAALGGAMLVAATVFVPESRSREASLTARRESPFRAYAILLRAQAFRLYLAASAANSAGFFTYIGASSSIFRELFGFSPEGYGLLFAVNSAALVAATQINRRLLRRRSALKVLRLSGRNALVLAAGFALHGLTGWGGLPALLVLLFCLVGGISPVQANTMAGGMGVNPLRAGSAAALFGTASFAAGALAAWLAGLLYNYTTMPFCLLIAGFLLGTAAAIHRLRRLPHPPLRPAI